MLKIILTDQQGGRAVLPEGTAYELNQATMQVTLINPQTGARLQLAGLLGETVQMEYPDLYWVSNPELPALGPPTISKQIITMTLPALPVHALAELFDCTVQKPVPLYDQGGWLPTPSPSHLELVDQLAKVIPGMGERVKHPGGKCAIGGNPTYTVRDMVIHMNDRHGWTFQQIADWLDGLDVDLTVHDPASQQKERVELVEETVVLAGGQEMAFLPGEGWVDIGYIDDPDEGAVMQTYTFDKPVLGKVTDSTGNTVECTVNVDFSGLVEKMQKLMAQGTLSPIEKED